MPSPTTAPTATRRGRRTAVLAVVVPPVAWAVALGASYAVQDFTCSAYRSAGGRPPEDAIAAVIVALDAVLVLATLAAGVVAARHLRRARREPDDLEGFLGVLGVALAALFGAGIVLVAINPLVLEVCA